MATLEAINIYLGISQREAIGLAIENDIFEVKGKNTKEHNNNNRYYQLKYLKGNLEEKVYLEPPVVEQRLLSTKDKKKLKFTKSVLCMETEEFNTPG